MRTLAGSPSCGAVFDELSWAASLLPLVFADLRRPWYDKLFVDDASVSLRTPMLRTHGCFYRSPI